MQTALVGFLILLPSPAFAEVCDKERPLWDGSKVGPVEELIYIVASPHGALLILLTVAAVLIRKFWVSFPVAALLLLFALMLYWDWSIYGDGIAYPAYREGCRGAPHVAIACLAAIALGLVLISKTRPGLRGKTL